jgi:hypothetical protein
MPASVVAIDASGTIVTVKFEVQDDVITFPNMKMPVFGPRFIRYPLRAGGDDGTKGFVVPSDYYMGGMSGLGGGVANLTQRPNLSTYVFFPVTRLFPTRLSLKVPRVCSCRPMMKRLRLILVMRKAAS